MAIQLYANKHGNSGVKAFDASIPGELTVIFLSGVRWIYSDSLTGRGVNVGPQRLRTMKSYAWNGLRLQRFINRHFQRR